MSSLFDRDLTALQDDRAVLTNPHKGWYFHYIDNGMKAPAYRNTIKPGDDLRAFPGLNHLYLRFDWNDIEPERGRYEWDKLDAIIDHWGRLGYRFSMRLCTYEANRRMIPYATPRWVFDAGARGFSVGAVEPDYGDPVYLEHLSNLMAEYGRRYNGHPLIDFIDVGTFGTWGEGHTTSGTCRVYPFDVLKRHVDLHAANFPYTFVLINDDMIGHCEQSDKAAAAYLAEYCAGRRMGIRDDSLYVDYYRYKFGYDMLARPKAFDALWRSGPVDLESGHQRMTPDNVTEGGLRMIEAMRRTHATYAGFHGDIYHWYDRHREFHDYAANHLGYWYFLERFSLPPLTQGLDAFLTLTLSNRGFAPAYHRYALKIALRDDQGREAVFDAPDIDNRRWMNGETAVERILLRTRALAPGHYALRLGLFDGARPIRWAIKSDCVGADGYVRLGDVEIAPR